MLKNVLLTIAGIVVVALGVFSYLQYSSVQDLTKKLGNANFKLYCLEQRDAYILGKGDKQDNIATMDVCQSSFNDDQKALIPK